MTAEPPGVLRFGVFELDLRGRELRRSGVLVRLPQQAYRALVLLASRAGEVVTRDELRQALWPEGTQVEFERGINFCINQVRQALRDPARSPRYVETLPRLGYRFLAEVRADGTSPPAPPPPSARPSAALRWAALVGALALAGFGTAGHRRPRAEATSVEPAAHEAYLRGRLLMRSGTPAGWEEARASFERAVAREPRYAAAQAGLSSALLWLNEAGLRSAHDSMPAARSAALAALREDPGLAEAWLDLATVRLYYDWDWGAAGDLERALALAPGLASAHNARAALLSARGQHEPAIEEGERAAELDPVCLAIRADLGWYYYCARRYDDAAARWRRGVVVSGGEGPHDRLVDAFRHLGRPRDAWREARETMVLAGFPAREADDLERRGIDSALSAFLAGSIRYLAGQGAPPERLAALHAALGQNEPALDLLERAARERTRGLLRALAVDPDFDALRGDRRFVGLLRQVGLKSSTSS